MPISRDANGRSPLYIAKAAVRKAPHSTKRTFPPRLEEALGKGELALYTSPRRHTLHIRESAGPERCVTDVRQEANGTSLDHDYGLYVRPLDSPWE